MNFVKSIYNTDQVLAMNHHHGIDCVGGGCRHHRMSKEIASSSHYRTYGKKVFNEAENDTTIWKFKDELMTAVEKTLRELKFKP